MCKHCGMNFKEKRERFCKKILGVKFVRQMMLSVHRKSEEEEKEHCQG